MKYTLFSKLISGDLGVFRFFSNEGKIEFKPGQFILLKDLKTGLFRPYSVASSPDFKYIELFIHFVKGKMTTLLEKAEIGRLFDISKGMGKFVYENEKKAVFIGGGVGTAPLLSIVRYIEINNIIGDFKAFFSFRNPNIPYLTELKIIKNIDINITFTRQKSNIFRYGRFNPEDTYLGKDYTYFICGSKTFVKSFETYILKNGGKIKSEGWR